LGIEPIDWTGDVSKEQQRISIRVMLSTITKVLPRKTGFGWRLQKFHEHLHIPDDIDRFGSPKTFDTSILENKLIYIGKQHDSSIEKWALQSLQDILVIVYMSNDVLKMKSLSDQFL
jgi:hypothetical protein